MFFKSISKLHLHQLTNLSFSALSRHTQHLGNNPVLLKNPFYSTSAMAQHSTVDLKSLLEKLKVFAPLTLAESWDNVGLLIEPQDELQIGKVLLTIDLTEEVVDEAVSSGTQLIISYHPNIFRPLKQVTQKHWKERIVNKCIRNNIAVFSPHTSWDAVKGGVNDWLASFLSQKNSVPLIVNPSNPDVGMGRLVTLNQPLTLQNAIDQVKKHIGLPHLRVGVGKNCQLNSQINTVAICAGSGASVFGTTRADLYLTGEMSHHEVLEATQSGINVILCNHSDSERGFLKEFAKKFQCDGVEFSVSKCDRDCLTII